jgi:hypothetical protein
MKQSLELQMVFDWSDFALLWKHFKSTNSIQINDLLL